MLQVHAFTDDREQLPQPTIWAETRHGNRLDCETAVLLRQVVSPLFEAATSWNGLRTNLRGAGYDFVFEEGRLILIETNRGTKICSCRFLGHPLERLAARFGKLRARPARRTARFGQAII